LDTGAAIDAKGLLGATALHWAAINSHRSTAELLVARGASLVVRDVRFNATPGEWANEGGHTAMANALRSGGGAA
jgi:ankyrin repeat protein